jgi:hypothetical protein
MDASLNIPVIFQVIYMAHGSFLTSTHRAAQPRRSQL